MHNPTKLLSLINVEVPRQLLVWLHLAGRVGVLVGWCVGVLVSWCVGDLVVQPLSVLYMS